MKKYKLFPLFGIGYMLILLSLILITLFYIDNNMTPYSIWVLENQKIKDDKYKKSYIKKEDDFFRLNYTTADISIGEKKKILVIGDSYIFGADYSNLNELWWKQLQLELYERGYYDIEIVAIGRAGASTYDEMLWLTNTDIIEDINPDLIIIGYVFNDPELRGENGNIHLRSYDTNNYFENNKFTKKFESIFPNVSYKINNIFQSKMRDEFEYTDETKYPISLWYNIISNEPWSSIYYKKAVKPLGKYLNSLSIPSFVVTTPDTVEESNISKYNILNEFDKANIKNYNIFEQILGKYKDNEKEYSKNLKINPVNGHPGTFYTKNYAEHIADILEQDYSSIIGTKYNVDIDYPIAINDYFPYSLEPQLIKSTKEYVEYELKPIDTEDSMLYLPIKQSYIKLALEIPISISKIEIFNSNIEYSNLYLTYINPELDYDTQEMYYIESKENKNEWIIENNKKITSINLNFKCEDGLSIRIYR